MACPQTPPRKLMLRISQSVLCTWGVTGRTDNDLKREKIPRVTHGTDLSQRDSVDFAKCAK